MLLLILALALSSDAAGAGPVIGLSASWPTSCQRHETYRRLRELSIPKRIAWLCNGEAPDEWLPAGITAAEPVCVGLRESAIGTRVLQVDCEGQLPALGNMIAGLGGAYGLAAESKRRFEIRFHSLEVGPPNTEGWIDLLMETFPVLRRFSSRAEATCVADLANARGPRGRAVCVDARSSRSPATVVNNSHSAKVVRVAITKTLLDSRETFGVLLDEVVRRKGESCFLRQHSGCITWKGTANREWMTHSACTRRLLFGSEINWQGRAARAMTLPPRGTALVALHVRVGDVQAGFGDRGYKRDVRVPSRYDWDRFFVCVLTRAQATLGRNFSIAFVTDMPSLRDAAARQLGHHLLAANKGGDVIHSAHNHTMQADIRTLADYLTIVHADLAIVGRSSFGRTAAEISGLPFLEYSDFATVQNATCSVDLVEP